MPDTRYVRGAMAGLRGSDMYGFTSTISHTCSSPEREETQENTEKNPTWALGDFPKVRVNRS